MRYGRIILIASIIASESIAQVLSPPDAPQNEIAGKPKELNLLVPDSGNDKLRSGTAASKNGEERKPDEKVADAVPLSVKIINPISLEPLPFPNLETGKKDMPPKWWPWPEIWPHPDWAFNALTFCLIMVGAAQIWVFGLQARRLEETVNAMREIDRSQRADVQVSIDATRASVELARQLFISTNRPRLRVRNIVLNHMTEGEDPRREHWLDGQVYISNIGSTMLPLTNHT